MSIIKDEDFVNMSVKNNFKIVSNFTQFSMKKVLTMKNIISVLEKIINMYDI